MLPRPTPLTKRVALVVEAWARATCTLNLQNLQQRWQPPRVYYVNSLNDLRSLEKMKLLISSFLILNAKKVFLVYYKIVLYAVFTPMKLIFQRGDLFSSLIVCGRANCVLSTLTTINYNTKTLAFNFQKHKSIFVFYIFDS